MSQRKAVGILTRPFSSTLAVELPLSIGSCCLRWRLVARVRSPSDTWGERCEMRLPVPGATYATSCLITSRCCDSWLCEPLYSTLLHRRNIEVPHPPVKQKLVRH